MPLDSTQDLHSKFQRQIEIEHEMTSRGKARYETSALKARTDGRETGTQAGTRLLAAALDPTQAAIEAFLEESRTGKPGRANAASVLLEGLDTRVVAYITARVVIDKIGGRGNMLQSIGISVANSIEDEARFIAYEQAANDSYVLTQRGLKDTSHLRHRKRVMVFQMNRAGVAWDEWPEAKKVLLGVRLIELFAEATGLVSIEQQDRSRYRVIATPATLEWIEKVNARCAELTPVYLPCIVPPKPWTTPTSGGYHTDAVRRLTLIKTRSKGFLEELFSADLAEVYSALNVLQNTAWKINDQVLKVATHMWDNAMGLGKVLPAREGADLPPKPSFLTGRKGDKLPDLTEEQKADFKDWKVRAAEAHKRFARSISRRKQASTILTVASRFVEEEEIYFPYTMDFRGRIYAQVPFLNPQGNDLAKGLLTFAHGKPVGDTGAYWLAVHGANVYGYDKASLDERNQWVEDNQPAILACAEDPLAHSFWQDADNPWLFLAFCFEWAGYRRSGADFVSNLPIALDGSCNGIQHFSAMLRDGVGGAAVNLVPSEKPSDIYGQVAEVTTAELRLLAATSGSDAELAKAWLYFGIDRKITKRSVMVLPYGGTYMACKEYVEEAVRERGTKLPVDPKDRKGFSKAVHFLAKVVWRSIAKVVIGAREVMAWLQACTRLATKASPMGLPINWPTPTGFPIQQAYRNSKLVKVQVRLFNTKVDLKIAREGPDIDAQRQAQGVAPNFVHSMDAAALVKCVNLSATNGLTSFAMIHDSYGTLAADTEMLGACLRHAFVDLYKEHDVLEEFRSSIVAMLPPELAEKVPPCPTKGSLDLDAVLKSDFFFA